MRVAVLGHVEWVEFLRVDRAVHPGAILHAASGWAEPAGGGGVAAVELARLAGSCALHTALGVDRADSIGELLAARGVTTVGPTRPEPHRRAVTLLDPSAERTIVVIGAAQHALGHELAADAFEGVDAVYVCKADAAGVRAARSARVLVATARMLPVLREAGVRLDALVHSSRDEGERYADGDLPVRPSLVASTEGERGGAWRTASGSGRWAAAPVQAHRDSYGAGDRFAAGLTFALARGMSVDDALAAAASSGAFALGTDGGIGPRGGDLA
jgi:ribokinase